MSSSENAEAREPEDHRAMGEMCGMARGVFRLQRYRADHRNPKGMARLGYFRSVFESSGYASSSLGPHFYPGVGMNITYHLRETISGVIVHVEKA